MEYIDGYKINEIENLKKLGFSLVDINRKLFEAFGYQIFQSGFVHADPHPGNSKYLFVLPACLVSTCIVNKVMSSDK